MVRRSAKLTEARRKARERAATQIEREESLLKLAEDFIVAEEQLDAIDGDLESQIAKIDERAERDRARARDTAEKSGEDLRLSQAIVAEQMIEVGVKPTEAASRLGISAGDLKKLRALQSSGEEAEPAGEPADDAVIASAVPAGLGSER